MVARGARGLGRVGGCYTTDWWEGRREGGCYTTDWWEGGREGGWVGSPGPGEPGKLLEDGGVGGWRVILLPQIGGKEKRKKK